MLVVSLAPACWRRRVARRAVLYAVALLTAAPVGCSKTEDRREVFPVKGQLFVDKKPAAGAIVWLHDVELLGGAPGVPGAVDPTVRANEPRPRGIVQEDGSFEVSTYGTGDGAPVGRYRLAIFWTKNSGPGDDGGISLLPVRYQDPKNSDLPIIEIKSEPNILPPLYLTAK
jgi:hypothetical protein